MAAAARRCPVCRAAGGDEFFAAEAVPVHCNVLHGDAGAARQAPRGDLRLVFCADCGLIYNAAFEPALVAYSPDYENSLHCSPRFADYAAELAQRLLAEQGADRRRVLEIGCGKGDFLAQLSAAGATACLGFDASYDGRHGAGLEIVRSGWDPDRAASFAPDLVVCRHVLEHIETPVEFLRGVRGALPAGCRAYFEVPDTMFTLRDLGVWDVIYEHCVYFTAPSLWRAFSEAGWSVRGVDSAFGGQFLWLEASVSGAGRFDPDPGERARLPELIDRFAAEHRRVVARWSETLAELEVAGNGVAVWGVGSKGVTFLNTVDRAAGIDVAIDINPRKVGRFVPGTGHRVEAPEALVGAGVGTVLAMNPNYREEIAGRLAELGVRADVVCV